MTRPRPGPAPPTVSGAAPDKAWGKAAHEVIAEEQVAAQQLAAQALSAARERIAELGEMMALHRWQDDSAVWVLSRRPGASPRVLFAAGQQVLPQGTERPSVEALLAACFLLGAVMLMLVLVTLPGRPAAGRRHQPVAAVPEWVRAVGGKPGHSPGKPT